MRFDTILYLPFSCPHPVDYDARSNPRFRPPRSIHLSVRLSLRPPVLCIHYRSAFFPNGDISVFYLAAIDHAIETWLELFDLPSFSPPTCVTPSSSSSSRVRIRSSPIISRRHHITQLLVAGNQSACLTPPDRPSSASSSSSILARRLLCLPLSPVALTSSLTRQELLLSDVLGPFEGIYLPSTP